MKRLHVSVNVNDIDRSVDYYSTLFAAEPTVLKPDYAKWMLDDPRVNFVIQTHGGAPGLDHFGIQVESGDELAEVAGRLKTAGIRTNDMTDAKCCYAVSDKSWTADPQGIAWECFHTTGQNTVYGADTAAIEGLVPDEVLAENAKAAEGSSCCS
jgi:catechol 2,3-dioxygenase-like lactoylglutathione lyase family enzyme